MSLPEIVAEIERNLDILATELARLAPASAQHEGHLRPHLRPAWIRYGAAGIPAGIRLSRWLYGRGRNDAVADASLYTD